MFKNKVKKTLIYFWGIIFITILYGYWHFRYIKYDKFFELGNLPDKIEFQNVDDWRNMYKRMNMYSLDESTENNEYYLRKNRFYIKSPDLIIVVSVDSNFVLARSGPTTLDSGPIRLFFYPFYNKLYVLSISDLSIQKIFQFPGQVEKAKIENDTLYFMLKKMGKVKYGAIKYSKGE